MELSVQQLACSRGGTRVLYGVSFALGPGQGLVLRGPNGSGKTTLLRTLAGLQPADAGNIGAPSASIVYAGHADGIKPTLTVRENLAFWAALYRGGRLSDALAAFELKDLADRPAQNLSAGQKRRLGLARLIVTGRPIWMLDEPTVSLDATATAIFARTVRAHLGQGGIALIATHIDLGLPEAEVLDLTPFRARATTPGAPYGAFDEAVE